MREWEQSLNYYRLDEIRKWKMPVYESGDRELHGDGMRLMPSSLAVPKQPRRDNDDHISE
jgi:hypothetical protein